MRAEHLLACLPVSSPAPSFKLHFQSLPKPRYLTSPAFPGDPISCMQLGRLCPHSADVLAQGIPDMSSALPALKRRVPDKGTPRRAGTGVLACDMTGARRKLSKTTSSLGSHTEANAPARGKKEDMSPKIWFKPREGTKSDKQRLSENHTQGSCCQIFTGSTQGWGVPSVTAPNL